MKSQQPSLARFDSTMDLPTRISLVVSAYKHLGYVNRRSLMTAYGLTQQQAGALMRDFIHAHASRIQWNMTHGHYHMTH